MITRLSLAFLLFSSCATYKRRELVREWVTTYDVVFTVEKVNVFDRKTDTLRYSRMDTSVMYYQEWRSSKVTWN